MILTVELKPGKSATESEVEIYCDSAGLDKLISSLQRLKASKEQVDHCHLNTPSWGGNELTEVAQGKGNILFKSLTIAVRRK